MINLYLSYLDLLAILHYISHHWCKEPDKKVSLAYVATISYL